MKSSKLLFDGKPLVISRALSRILGPSKAIAIQQIHYWCERSKDFANPLDHFIDGKWWVYNTYEEWTKQFCIGSERTVRRVLKELENKELILIGNHHRDKYNRTKWYAINHEKLDELYHVYDSLDTEAVPCGQNDQVAGQPVKSCDKVSRCTSGQSVKENDKVSTCIRSTENTQSLSEITTCIDIFKAYTQNAKLLMALECFYEMRIEMGKKLTLAATRMILEDLEALANSDEEKILILKKSVLNNWKELFALPKTTRNNKPGARIEEEMKRRGDDGLKVVHPDHYYDWIEEAKQEIKNEREEK